MKRVSAKLKKKLKAGKDAAIRKMRGKYKQLDLMKALIASRAQDRQSREKLTPALARRPLL
jgi:hypothetical protein